MYGCGNQNNNKYRYKYKKIKRKYKLKKPRRWNDTHKYKRPYKRFFRKNSRYQKKDLEEKPQSKDDPKIEDKASEPKSQVHEAIRNRINRSKMVLHEEISSINKERFLHYFNMAEASDENKEQCFFTIDKKRISLYAFFEKARPEMVKEVYDCGLLSMVYPSNNLIELSLLPKPIFHAIKNYRTKVIGSVSKEYFLYPLK